MLTCKCTRSPASNRADSQSDLGINGSNAEILDQLGALSCRDVLDYHTKNPLGLGGSLNPAIDGTIVVRGVGRIGNFGYRVNDLDRAYADMARAYRVQFAKTGDPNGNNRPGWRSASAGNEVLLGLGQTEPVVQRDFRTGRRDFYFEHFVAGRL